MSLLAHQTRIGGTKLFLQTTGFEMQAEDTIVYIQVLDVILRLTSGRWDVKPWNYFDSFSEFLGLQGMRNVGNMLHANRFGEFEERCAGGVYMLTALTEWLSAHPEIRNNLSCYLRASEGIFEQCPFQWAGTALIGIHLTIPFMAMLLEHKVTQLQLLKILPQFYTDLQQNQPWMTCSQQFGHFG